ncbi:hypothetical protein [Chitinimonas koreensis]|uniref:hypothetical protein n=1 Tax=Chitinimonas koreensis TaxID=356302 RepID=UPI0016548406|nr:hypothetical protein [Chitinimonas koreensis]QNM98754.1 hypothetical protein H9L41_11375 [Chitinimonas koreensis]
MEAKVPNQGISWWEPGNNFKCTVYNIEVANYHTYYVGEHGLWVHNDCGDVTDAINEAFRNEILPTNSALPYFSLAEAYARSKSDPLKGMILVQETATDRVKELDWWRFQRGLEGPGLVCKVAIILRTRCCMKIRFQIKNLGRILFAWVIRAR